MPRSFIVSIKLVCESEPRLSVTEHLNWVKTIGAYETGFGLFSVFRRSRAGGTEAEHDA